jgi:hypothetical protein
VLTCNPLAWHGDLNVPAALAVEGRKKAQIHHTSRRKRPLIHTQDIREDDDNLLIVDQ